MKQTISILSIAFALLFFINTNAKAQTRDLESIEAEIAELEAQLAEEGIDNDLTNGEGNVSEAKPKNILDCPFGEIPLCTDDYDDSEPPLAITRCRCVGVMTW